MPSTARTSPGGSESLLVVATIPVLAVLAGTVGAAAVMFFSAHDLVVMLSRVRLLAGPVACGCELHEGA